MILTVYGKKNWAMKKNKAHNLAAYSFSCGETFLLDANVWLYLYPPPSTSKRRFARQYSNGLKSMQSAGAQLIMDAIVLSEYLNAYCRIEWKALHQTQYPEFKSFRKSAAFEAVGKGAASFARSMLKLCVCHDHAFSEANVKQVLTDFAAGATDFNDGLLVETCRHNGWKLVTNDSDFTSGGIEVLTTHPKLLAACP